MREKVQKMQTMEKTERTNLGEDGNDGTNVGDWVRSEVQNMKKKGNEPVWRRRKRCEKNGRVCVREVVQERKR